MVRKDPWQKYLAGRKSFMNEMNEKGERTGNGSENGPFNLVIVGGGRACKLFLEAMRNEQFYSEIRVVGVCDVDPEAVTFCLSREIGIYRTDNYTDFFDLKEVDGVFELTGSQGNGPLRCLNGEVSGIHDRPHPGTPFCVSQGFRTQRITAKIPPFNLLNNLCISAILQN